MMGSLNYTKTYFTNFNNGIIEEGINPNTIAIIIVTTCIFFCIYIDSKRKSKLLKIVVYAISLIGLYRTRSRTSLVAFLSILLLEYVLMKKVKESRKLAIAITIFVIVVAIIFPFIYVGLFTSGTVDYSTLFFGKRVFTGRQYIWLNLWNYLQNNHDAFLWGVGFNTELYSGGSFNLHNAFLMIFAQYGILVFVVYIAFLIRSISKMYGADGKISDIQFKCYQILIYALIVGFGETVFSYLPNLIFIATAIGISNRERMRIRQNDTESNTLLLVWQ